jgi:O-6-methylguanine DNA methyltransferase
MEHSRTQAADSSVGYSRQSASSPLPRRVFIIIAMYYTTFESVLGTCGLGWSHQGIRRIQLPERRRGQVEVRLRLGVPEATMAPPSSAIGDAIARIRRHLGGDLQDFSSLPLDLEGIPSFHQRIYDLIRSIPAGGVRTYREIARLAGRPGASRAVGQAMARNPVPIVVPCHRVVAAGGRPGGFSAAGGIVTKSQLLALEGVRLPGHSAPLFAGNGELPYDREAAADHLRASDPLLAELMTRAGSFRLELDRLQSPFAALAESIVYQQLTGKAAATIHRRLLDLYRPRRRLRPEDILATQDERLRSAGLSRAKVAALKDLSAKTLEGVVPTLARLRKMNDEEIISRLTTIRGIGRWTVEMLLIFRLGRPDVLPASDYGVQKGFAKAFRKRKLPTPVQLARHGRRWAPYRSVAAWYLWRAVDQPKSAGEVSGDQ